MERLYLWEKGKVPYFKPEYGQEETTLTPYLLNDGKKSGCVIVCPGGAYRIRADHEGGPVAEEINKYGVNAFVLNYRLFPYKYPAITEDVLRAVRYVRYHADEFNIDPNKIAVLGFSAGGHLANSSMCVFDYGREDGDEIDKVSSRPDGVILCYGVISLKKYTHGGSKDVLIGGLENEEELANKMSGELAVKDDTPPCFIWHTQDDQAVPVWNSLDLYSSLTKQGIPAALHVFPHGQHGLGLAEGHNDVSKWSELLGLWLFNEGFIK